MITQFYLTLLKLVFILFFPAKIQNEEGGNFEETIDLQQQMIKSLQENCHNLSEEKSEVSSSLLHIYFKRK